MQYRVSYDRGSVYSRNVKFSESYTRYSVPISYLYKGIEILSVLNTDRFFSKGLYDTGYHHTEKFAYKDEIRKVGVSNGDTFAFYFNTKYAFIYNNGDFVCKTWEEAENKQHYLFGDRNIAKAYNVFGDIFIDVKKDVSCNNYTAFGNKTVHGYKILEDIKLAKVHLRSANTDNVKWLSDLKKLDHESISFDSISNINDLEVNKYFTNAYGRLGMPINQMYDFKKISKIKLQAYINSIEKINKDIYRAERLEAKDLVKEDGNLYHEDFIELSTDTPYLYVNKLLEAGKDIYSLVCNTDVEIDLLNKYMNINNQVAISNVIKDAITNSYIPTSIEGKSFSYNSLVSVGTIIRDTVKNEVSTVNTTKGSLYQDELQYWINQNNSDVSINRYVIINTSTKDYQLNSNLTFFKLQKEMFTHETIAININHKLVSTENGFTFKIRYKDMSEHEMYCIDKGKMDSFTTNHKAFSDIIKESYFEKTELINKVIKDSKNTISKGTEWVYRDKTFNSSVYNFNAICKDYKDLSSSKNVFIERNVFKLFYNKQLVPINKAIKFANRNIDISVLKYLHNIYGTSYVNVYKNNRRGISVNKDTTIEKELEAMKYLNNTFFNKYNHDIELLEGGHSIIPSGNIVFGKAFKSSRNYDDIWFSKNKLEFNNSSNLFFDKSEESLVIGETYIYGVVKDYINSSSNTDGLIEYIKENSLKYSNNIVQFKRCTQDVYANNIFAFNKGGLNLSIDDGSCKWLNSFKATEIVDTIIKMDISERDICDNSLVIEYTKNTNVNVEDTNVNVNTSSDNAEYNDNINISNFKRDIGTKENVALTDIESNVMVNEDVKYDSIKGSLFSSNNVEFELGTDDIQTDCIIGYSGNKKDSFEVDNITTTKRDKGTTNYDHHKTLSEIKETNGNSPMVMGKVEKNTDSEKVLTVDKAYILGNNDDVSTIVSKHLKEGGNLSDTNIVIAKLEHLIEKVPGLQKIITDRELKEVYIECNGKWADGDEYEKPSIGADGIDELLLPGTDYDYTKLEGTVIDSEGKPIGDVEIIDNRTFITSTPIKHPLPESSNIGINYIDLDVNVLRHLIDVTYKLWMKKAFQFGAIDMREAMSILIDDLSAYVSVVMDEPDKPHAARVIRLIRWYGEAAINNHAKYKITVDYGKLSSDLYEGTCKIPHSFNNMHIDNKMYTITNTVTGTECSAEFYIENPVNTKVQFILQVTSGVVKISMNGIEVDKVGVGMHTLEYDVEKLDTPNALNIFYNGLNNGIINLSNLVIFDKCYKGYSLDYHPIRGSGNKVMDNLIKYLANYEDIIDNNKEYIEAVKDNNYAITDMISRMLEYFELHHENKNKGKRLTIKK